MIKEDPHRINNKIFGVNEVRVVGEGVEAGVYPFSQALRMAEDMGLDLVEISASAVPPVCRITDYKKFLYDLKKKQKEIKAKAATVEMKEIRFGPNTDEHDVNFKLKHARKFLEEGHKIKAFVFFRGRTIVFKERGEILLERSDKLLAKVRIRIDLTPFPTGIYLLRVAGASAGTTRIAKW